jgi:xanthine dehydrogenase accessory factor
MVELAAPLLNYRCAWLQAVLDGLRAGQPQVLVTVAQAKGSTPRDPGARMWVNASAQHDTIGGGHLEQLAIETARGMLTKTAPRRQVVRYPLGPALGQCCGGVVWLAFEYLDQRDISWCEAVQTALARGQSVQRTVCLPLFSGNSVALDAACSTLDGVQVQALPLCADKDQGEEADSDGPSDDLALTTWDESSGVMLDTITRPALNVVVCGAGHVGLAIVRLLGDLPVHVVWLDPRDDCWPEVLPGNVTCIQGDADDVIDCPDNAYWLVLTHSHALDLEIVEAVFAHKPFSFLGLIGSKTKKARFVSRLRQRFPEELVDRMQCPIGLVATSSKLPSVIAISVVAQIIPLLEDSSSRRP